MASAHGPKVGLRVFGMDGAVFGVVLEVRDDMFLVNRGLSKSPMWLPAKVIHTTTGDRITLICNADRAEKYQGAAP